MPLDETELNRIGHQRLSTPVPPLCPQCGYNLTGLNEPPCPECGYEFDWRSVRKKAREHWLEAIGLKTLPEEIEFGFRAACIAWGLFVVVRGGGLLLGAGASCALDVLFMLMFAIEVTLAFCGAFLCSHVVRFQRLPLEAREELRIDVPILKAWAGLVGAAVLLAVSVPTCVRAFLH